MNLHPPLWHEGALLLPQHFQQQQLLHAAEAASAAQLAVAHPWGVRRVLWDSAALETGHLKLQQLQLRLPDGSTVDSRRGQPLPAARLLSDVPAQLSAFTVLLGLPLWEAEGNNVAQPGEHHARARRFVAAHEQVAGLFGEEPSEMAVARLNLVLLLEHEPQADYVCCAIGRFVRNAAGGFEPDTGWLPPALTLDAHDSLQGVASRMADILLARSVRLAARRGERNQNLADYSVSDVSLFWLLNAVNGAWPDLLHLSRHPVQHPERLWLVLARLAAALASFSLEPVLPRIPPYRHDDLQAVFGQLEALVRELLDTVIPSPVVPLQLERLRPTLWRATLHDERLLQDADFFLSVQAAVPGHQLQQQLPVVAKIGAPDEVERILNSALTGVPLQPLERVPSAVPLRLENQYFALDGQHPAFRRMLDARSCSLYIPASLTDAVPELFAVLRA